MYKKVQETVHSKEKEQDDEHLIAGRFILLSIVVVGGLHADPGALPCSICGGSGERGRCLAAVPGSGRGIGGRI